MSVDRKKKLEDALDTLLEMESIKNFDFELWKARYLKWLQTKKMRITDFFRRQDKDGDGFLSRDEFVNGMLHSGKCIDMSLLFSYYTLNITIWG